MQSFARHGASTQIIALLATFLRERTMVVRINQEFSPPLPVFGGCPKGSLLGVFLFNISTDDVEISPPRLLEDTDNSEVQVGYLFDEPDREIMRRNETPERFELDPDSVLLPEINVKLTQDAEDLTESFEDNGRVVEISDSELPNINCLLYTSPSPRD